MSYPTQPLPPPPPPEPTRPNRTPLVIVLGVIAVVLIVVVGVVAGLAIVKGEDAASTPTPAPSGLPSPTTTGLNLTGDLMLDHLIEKTWYQQSIGDRELVCTLWNRGDESYLDGFATVAYERSDELAKYGVEPEEIVNRLRLFLEDTC